MAWCWDTGRQIQRFLIYIPIGVKSEKMITIKKQKRSLKPFAELSKDFEMRQSIQEWTK